ncbi:hypothetical protein FRB97_000184, partial [Tulasnella sp. 331]
VSPIHGIDMASKLIAQNLVQLSFSANVTNSSVVGLVGPVATPDQLSSSLATRVLHTPVTFTSTCQRWAAVSTSRLTNGVSIPLDAAPNFTALGFRRDCYNWRNIAIRSTPLAVDAILVQSSYHNLVHVTPRPVVFLFILLVAFLSAIPVIDISIFHLDLAIEFCQAVMHTGINIVAGTYEAKVEGLHLRSAFKMVVRVIAVLAHPDAEDEIATLKATIKMLEDKQVTDETLYPKQVGRRSRAAASLKHQRSNLCVALDVERTRIACLQREKEFDMAIIELLQCYHTANLADEDYLITLVTWANATSERQLQTSRHAILSLMRASTILFTSHADQGRECKKKLAATKSKLDLALHTVGHLEATLLEKDDIISSLQSEVEDLKKAHEAALDANHQLVFEKGIFQEGLQIQLDLRLAAEKKLASLIATPMEEMEKLRQELLDVQRGRADDTLAAATTIDQLRVSNAELRDEISNLIHHLRDASDYTGKHELNLHLAAVQNARLVALEDMVRNLGGEVGCAETDILGAVCDSEGSYEDQMIYYDHPPTSNESDDETAINEPTPDTVPCHLPEVASIDFATHATTTPIELTSLQESTSDNTAVDSVKVAVDPVKRIEAPRVGRFAGNNLLTSALKGIGAFLIIDMS